MLKLRSIFILFTVVFLAGSGVISESTDRISVQKCNEYSNIHFKQVTAVGLSLSSVVVKKKILDCETSTGLIVGGEVAKIGEFPHMAVLGWSKTVDDIEWNCGGSLISDYFVVTAAHCAFNQQQVAPDIVRLGEQNLTDEDDTDYIDFQIDEFIRHPNYSSRAVYNDIALIRLKDKVFFRKDIRPACLWQTGYFNETVAYATGWGVVGHTGEQSNDLLKVGLTLINNTACNTLVAKNRKMREGVLETQLCAGELQGDKDTCQGDSGGPLQFKSPVTPCTYNLIGVTSYGSSCGAANSPAVYTRISSYLEWIESIVWS